MRLVAALVGESLREMAVLVGVFAPLDFFVQGKALTLRFAFATMTIVAVLFVLGVALEVRSRWKD